MTSGGFCEAPPSMDEKGKGALGVFSSRRGQRGISRCTAPSGVQKRPVGRGTTDRELEE